MAEHTTAREYLRVSHDRSGRERSNTEQRDDHRRTWPDWAWGEPYRDKTSASRYATKAREGYPQLIEDLRTGRFGAEILVLWESSRGSRKVGEWVVLLDLLEETGVRLAIHQHNRIYDPAIPRDRRTLLEDAVDSEYESAKTSGRIQRNAHSGAVAGRPHGKVLFGYRRIYDQRTGILLGQEADPVQAPIVERMFTDYLGGTSVRAIARWLNDEAVKTNRGNGWNPTMVKRLLANRHYVARRTYRGEDFGSADWEPIIDPTVFERVQQRREATGWRRPRITSRLCSTVARCGTCDGRMYVNVTNSGTYYMCEASRCAARRVDRLDAFVTAAVLERLSRPDAADLLAGGEDEELATARARLAGLKAELAEAMEMWRRKGPDGKRALTLQGYAAMEAELLPQIAAAERDVRRALVPIDIDLPPAEKVPHWWEHERTPEQRREIVGALAVSVIVRSVGRGCRNFDDDDYTAIHWRR